MLKALTPNLMVEDMERTLAYYREVLGVEVGATAPDAAPYDWAMLRRDGVSLMVQTRASMASETPLFADMPLSASLSFYVEVTEIEALYAQVKDRAEILRSLHTTFYGT